MFRRFFCLFVLIAVAIISVACSPNNPHQEEYVGDSISYVSLGDSIPEGYALPDYAYKNDDGFVKHSYTNSLKAFFQRKYKNVTAHNYATTGLTSTQLKEQLLDLNNETLTETQQDMKTNITGANVITVCIGANDILSPAQDNFIDIVLNDYVSPYFIEFDNGIALFNVNFPIIVSQLRELNPTAKLIFSSIYNPYTEFLTATSNIEICYLSFKIHDITPEKINLIGQMSEIYTDSGTIYGETNKAIKTVNVGLNQIIENIINGIENCYLLDVKDCYDNYFSINNDYNVINSTALEHNRINFTLSNPLDTQQTMIELQTQVLPYIDPHPSTLGHNEIKNILIEKVIDVLNIKASS